MMNVLRFTTRFVDDQVEEEYSLAMERFKMYIFIRNDEDVHRIRPDGGFRAHEFAIVSFLYRCACGHTNFVSQKHIHCRSCHSMDKHRRKTCDSDNANSQRYTEALRATQLIASALADIEGGEEVQQMLDFVNEQWCNVRPISSELSIPRSYREPGNRSVLPQIMDEDLDSSEGQKNA
ncbi:LOW QUALITY PROTEIN: hypothetical protein PHMEG_0006870 [Phytophthora megakarya]|uniref:Uncharacterized protein n=1 Tax=Phytophthora megakarya TaxID=4795 RepID=A0A225WMT1_9STRA|nr:LOW QUALITY PROTEIN: hypothetical protein PHMEG_0006870 [Phytophthora megakarya]